MEKIEEIPAKRLELPPCIDILYKPEEMGGGHPFVRANKQNLSCLGHYDLPRRCPAPSSALSRPPPALAGPALVLPGDKHTTKDEGRAPFLARTAAVVSLPLLSVPATAPSTCCPAAKDDRSA